MSNAPKDASTNRDPALDEDLELNQSDTDAVAGGSKKGRDGRDSRAARPDRLVSE
jgi:hypothetical protein